MPFRAFQRFFVLRYSETDADRKEYAETRHKKSPESETQGFCDIFYQD